jgi:hypothetical protein
VVEGWIKIALQQSSEIRKAFLRAKSDVLELRRAINRQFFKLEETEKRLRAYTLKEEFYSFIKNLSNKLDSMEQSLASKKELESLSQEISNEINSLKRAIQRRENLKSELSLVRQLNNRLIDFEGKFLDKKRFNEEFDYLNKAIINVKKQLVREALLKQTVSQLEEMQKKIYKFEKIFLEKNEFSKAKAEQNKTVKELKEQISELSKTVEEAKELDVAGLATKQQLKKLSEELNNQLKNFEDKKTTAEFNNRLKKIEEKAKRIEETEKKAGEVAKKVELLQKETRVEKLPALKVQEQIKALRKDVDYLMNNLVMPSELNAQVSSLNDRLDELRKELKKTKVPEEEIDKKVTELAVVKIRELMKVPEEKPKPEVKVAEEEVAKPGITKRIWQSVTDFFKEEEREAEGEKEEAKEAEKEEKGLEEKKAIKKTWKEIPEFFKEEEQEKAEEKIEEIKGEKETKKSNISKYIKWIAVLTVISVAGYFLVFKMPQYKYVFFALLLVIIIAIIIFKGGKEEELEEEKEATIDLEEFFKEEEEIKEKIAEKKKKTKVVEKESVKEKAEQVKKKEKTEEEKPKKGFLKRISDALFEEEKEE